MQPSSIHSSSFLPSASGGVFLPAIQIYVYIYIYICMYVTRIHAGPITLSLSLCGLSLLVCICRLVSIRELTYGS